VSLVLSPESRSLHNLWRMWHHRRMNPTTPPHRDTHDRVPTEMISHSVWLYDRFCLSYRDVEEWLFAGGIAVTDEAIRQWCRRFGQRYAHHGVSAHRLYGFGQIMALGRMA
jgi:transposase-like protein